MPGQTPLKTTVFDPALSFQALGRLTQIRAADPNGAAALSQIKFYKTTGKDLVAYLTQSSKPTTSNIRFLDFRDASIGENLQQIPNAYSVSVPDAMPYDSMPAIGALSQVKWNALKATNYVVCYCAAGTNRSPIGVVNVAYFAYLANEAFPPKIVLLEGGFGGYQQIKGAPITSTSKSML